MFNIVFSDTGFSTSIQYRKGSEVYPATSVNFKIYNITTNKEVHFAFRQRAFITGRFAFNLANGRSDEIIFLTSGDTVASWQVDFLSQTGKKDTILPGREIL